MKRRCVQARASISSEFSKSKFSRATIYVCLTRQHQPLKLRCDVMSEPAAIRIISPEEFDAGTAQTPGSERLAAVSPQLGVDSALWSGLFKVEPGARTG